MARPNWIGGQACSHLELRMAKVSVTNRMISVRICIHRQQEQGTKMTITLALWQIVGLILLTPIVAAISMTMVILIAMALSHHWFKRRLHQMYHEIQTDSDQGSVGYGGSVNPPNLLKDGAFDEILEDLDIHWNKDFQLPTESITVGESAYDTPGFSTTGMVPGGVSYVGRTETQFGSAATQLNSKRKPRWFRKGQNAISRR